MKFLDRLPECKVGGKKNERIVQCGGRTLVSLLNISVYKLLRILIDSKLKNEPYRVRASDRNEWITVPKVIFDNTTEIITVVIDLQKVLDKKQAGVFHDCLTKVIEQYVRKIVANVEKTDVSALITNLLVLYDNRHSVRNRTVHGTTNHKTLQPQ